MTKDVNAQWAVLGAVCAVGGASVAWGVGAGFFVLGAAVWAMSMVDYTIEHTKGQQ